MLKKKEKDLKITELISILRKLIFDKDLKIQNIYSFTVPHCTEQCNT